MTETFSIGEVLKEAKAHMKPMRWKIIGQYAIISLLIPIVLYIALGKLAGIASLVTAFMLSDLALGYAEGRVFHFGDLFDRYTFKTFFYFCIAVLLVALSIFGGFILLIVPGIVFAVRLSFVKLIAVDKKLSPMAALKESKRITKGYRWKVLGFLTVCALINLLGFICLIVGTLYTGPLTNIARAVLYKKLVAKADAIPDASVAEMQPQ